MISQFDSSEPKVDIILPNYNKGEFLEESIKDIAIFKKHGSS